MKQILLTVSGSRSYGVHTESSDLDVKGVLVGDRKHVYGMDVLEQVQDAAYIRESVKGIHEMANACEGVVYEVRKFMRLASGCNPNIMDVLFCRDSEVLRCDESGELLRENRNLFLTRKAKYTYSGYAVSQLNRIKSHRKWLLNPPNRAPERSDFGLPDTRMTAAYETAFATVRAKIDSWEIDFGDLDEAEKIRIKEMIATSITESQANTFLSACLLVGYSEEVSERLVREHSFAQAVKEWKQYNEWKTNRNEARAELERKHLYDTKHAMHLVRLLHQAEEIFRDGVVNVWRPDREMLLDIRNGAWSYDQLVEYAEEKKSLVDTLAEVSNLPRSPDMGAINNLCMEIVQHAMKEV